MIKFTKMLMAAGVCLAVSGTLAAAQDGGSVVVYRGGEAETVRFTDRGGVTVVRGQPAARAAEAAVPTVLADGMSVVGGDTLWVVDGNSGRLVACELRQTAQVGGRRIRCIERAWPAALR